MKNLLPHRPSNSWAGPRAPSFLRTRYCPSPTFAMTPSGLISRPYLTHPAINFGCYAFSIFTRVDDIFNFPDFSFYPRQLLIWEVLIQLSCCWLINQHVVAGWMHQECIFCWAYLWEETVQKGTGPDHPLNYLLTSSASLKVLGN